MTEHEKLLQATCPECRGPMSERQLEAGPSEYVCLVGHRYSGRVLLDAHSEAEEKALWAAVVALEEAAVIVRAVSLQFPPPIAAQLETGGAKRIEFAKRIRDILQALEPFPTG